MSDVFISYARQSAEQAQRITEMLRAQGFGVWRDDELPAHRPYAEVIEERLKAAAAVVVVWSEDAASSHWVRSEADRARLSGKLVQVRVDQVQLPMPFDQIQCADLSGWGGAIQHPGWRKASESVRQLVASGVDAGAPHASAEPGAGEPLLAVLAFDNLSGDQEMAYFSDGISEEILDTVARGSNLKVISRASSFQFRGPDKAVRRVMGVLRATHLLDGSVRRAGSRVRISAQLVECASDTTLWADRFDRELTDVFALQDEIAEAVAAALKTVLAPAPRPREIRPEAYEAYLRAQAMMNTAVGPWVDQAVLPVLEQVVEGAPAFSAAWESLSLVRVSLLRSGRAGKDYAKARAGVVEAAETALRLDPSRGRAYLALAQLEPWAAYASRETLVDRGLAANGNDASLIFWRAHDFAVVGRAGEAVELARRGAALDPLLPAGRLVLAHALAGTGHYDEILALCDGWLAVPEPAPECFAIALHYAAVVRDWARFDRWEAMASPDQPMLPVGDADLRRYLRNLRHDDRADMQAKLGEVRAFVARTGSVPLNALTELELYGFRDEAYALLETASFDRMFGRDGPLPSMAYSPAMIFHRTVEGGLQADPRFLDLCAKVGLVAYWLGSGRWPDCAATALYDFRAEARKAADEGRARRV